jgi:hypothetical protein
MKAVPDTRRERFCHEYVKDRDARSAAIRAGYKAGTGIGATASRLLGDAVVRARIAALQEPVATAARVGAVVDPASGPAPPATPVPAPEPGAGWVVAELVKIARADPRKFFQADGTPKKVHELGDDEAAALLVFESSGAAGKVIDRLKVLELLGRHFGLWPQKAPSDINLFEGMSLDDVRRVRDRIGRLLGGAGMDLPGSEPSHH